MSSNAGDEKRIFVGSLASDTTLDTLIEYFEKYGVLLDYVIMKNQQTGQPRAFGFVTFADPSVIDTIMKEPHVINGKRVVVKRAKPRKSAQNNIDSKMKRLFVGGIPKSVTEADFKESFSKYGTVLECEIVYDHETMESRGFGFIEFDSEKAVDNLLAHGNLIDMGGKQVGIRKAEPKKVPNPTSGPAFGSDYGTRLYNNSFGGFGSYGDFSPASYISLGSFGGRLGDYEWYGGGGPDFGGSFGGFVGGGFPGYSAEYSYGYSSQLGGSGLGAYGRAGYGSYGGFCSAGWYHWGPATRFGGPGWFYGGRGGYGGRSGHNPYGR